jgi:hypothetical protein
MAFLLQAGLDEVGHLHVVFDYEDAHQQVPPSFRRYRSPAGSPPYRAVINET